MNDRSSAARSKLKRLYRIALAAVSPCLALCCFGIALLCALGANPALSKEALPLAQDERVEQRLIDISSELRCLVCQNETLSASSADLANDLRREIRTLIKEGKSDAEIMDFMVSRYGDFVRYRPPLKETTLLLWFGPALFLAGALAALFFFLHRRNKAIKDSPLSAEQQRQADRLLQAKESRQ